MEVREGACFEKEDANLIRFFSPHLCRLVKAPTILLCLQSFVVTASVQQGRTPPSWAYQVVHELLHPPLLESYQVQTRRRLGPASREHL